MLLREGTILLRKGGICSEGKKNGTKNSLSEA